MLTKKLIFAVMFILMLASGAVQAGGDPAKGLELSSDCSDCHGDDGKGFDDYPQISGLDEDYMFEQLVAIKNGERANGAEIMLWFFEDLDEQDLADLAAYYSLQGGG